MSRPARRRKTPDAKLVVVKLGNHLELVDMAETICVSKVESINDDKKIEDCLRGLQKNLVPIPTNLKAKLWDLRTGRLADSIQSGHHHNIEPMVLRCIPWRCSNDDVEADLTFDGISLGDLEDDPIGRAKKAWGAMMDKFLLPLCAEGEATSVLVKVFSEKAIATVGGDDVPEIEAYEDLVCDLLTVWRVLIGLMTPESMEAGLADDLHAVRSVKGREDIAMFRDMLRCNKFWADLCTKFDAAKEFHAEYSAEMHSARIRFGGHLPMDAETVQVMTQDLRDLAKWEAKLRSGACDATRDEFMGTLASWLDGYVVETVVAEAKQPMLELLTVQSWGGGVRACVGALLLGRPHCSRAHHRAANRCVSEWST